MARPGPLNLITDVAGIRVGHADLPGQRTGATVVLAEAPAVAACDIRGGAPGTRETDLLDPACLVEAIDAITLSGGSAFGLDAASGVVAWLAAQGRGFPAGPFKVPIVPAAILFDLMAGGDKPWLERPGEVEPPYRQLGFQAAAAAAAGSFALGNIGAGYGAVAGMVKGGLGSASARSEDGLVVGALVVANPVGAVTVPGTETLWAWSLEQDGEMGRQTPPAAPAAAAEGDGFDLPKASRLFGHTTIGVVATNARLTKAEARRIAIMAHDGLARAIRPVHTPLDGDSLFVMATGAVEPAGPRPLVLARIGHLAADVVARAIGRGVHHAAALPGIPAYRGGA